jgi:hypothetical protein
LTGAGRRVIIVLVVTATVLGCVSGPDLSHYVEIIDKIPIPQGWQLVHTQNADPAVDDGCSRLFPSCPSVMRWYLADGEPSDLYPPSKQLLRDAGFSIRQEIAPDCDTPPSAAACGLVADAGEDVVRINLFNAGEDPAGLGIADPARSLVLVVADGG